MAKNNNYNEVANAVQKYLKKSNINVSYIPYTDVVQGCFAWYKGLTNWHNYFIWNGMKKTKHERARLGMAKIACEDWASLLMNEKVRIVAEKTKENLLINKVLSNNNFEVQANQLIELMFALGTGAFVETWQGNKVVIDYIQGDLIFPLKWDNGVITECAFAKIGATLNKALFTLILYTLEEVNGVKQYVIKTVEIDGDGGVCKPTRPIQIAYGMQVKEGTDNEFTSIIYTNSDVPCFQIIKPNIVNNYDKTNPLGMNIIYNSVDILKNIDVEYDSLLNEFLLGKKRIFIKSGLKSIKKISKSEANSALVNHIDADDTLFYSLDTEDDGKLPIEIFDPSLRTSEHEIALNTQLNLFSRAVGLGDGFYEFNAGKIARTATEIVSINSALYRNLCKHELVLEKAIKGLGKAILVLYNLYNNDNYDVDTLIDVNFDDSIIQDNDKIREQAMAEYNAGLIDKAEYFVLTESMTRENAVKKVAEMEATDTMKEVSNIMNNFGGDIGGISE